MLVCFELTDLHDRGLYPVLTHTFSNSIHKLGNIFIFPLGEAHPLSRGKGGKYLKGRNILSTQTKKGWKIKITIKKGVWSSLWSVWGVWNIKRNLIILSYIRGCLTPTPCKKFMVRWMSSQQWIGCRYCNERANAVGRASVAINATLQRGRSAKAFCLHK